MTFIKQAKTPTLILHGAAGHPGAAEPGAGTLHGTRKNNVPVEMVFFPRENHGFIEPRHFLDKMKRETAFIEKYLNSAKP